MLLKAKPTQYHSMTHFCIFKTPLVEEWEMEWVCMATEGLVTRKEGIACELGQISGYGEEKNQGI